MNGLVCEFRRHENELIESCLETLTEVKKIIKNTTRHINDCDDSAIPICC